MFFLAALGVVVGFLALPVVLLMGGPAAGWALGFGLWLANWGAQLGMAKLSLGMTPTMAVGLSGISFIARAWLVTIILFIVALRFSHSAGLVAAAVFLACFTFDLMGRTVLFSVRERMRREGLTE
jgi:hypothetical protein